MEIRNIGELYETVLGEIRIVLQRVQAHAAYDSLDIRRRVDEGIAHVGRAFGE